MKRYVFILFAFLFANCAPTTPPPPDAGVTDAGEVASEGEGEGEVDQDAGVVVEVDAGVVI